MIIFDTPASLDTMGLLALAACIHLLAPIKPEYKDTGSFVDLLNWYNEKIRELRLKPRPEILGEKLHPLDLANGLVRLMVMRHPQLNEQVKAIPSLLNAVIQRLRRSREITELEAVAIADQIVQQEWIEKVCVSETERWVLEAILSKQLNPVSINSNVFTLLSLLDDLQSVIRTAGLEGSKVLELSKGFWQKLAH